MPVLLSTDKIAPKSILRHRPIGENVTPTGKITSPPLASPVVPRASRTTSLSNPRPAETEEATKKTLPPGLRPKTRLLKQQDLRRAHPLFYLGAGMLGMLLLWMVLSVVIGWCTTAFDDLRYGRPRTFQIDARVGHNEQTGLPSHFIALNLRGRVEVIEIPGGDASHMRVYIGPQLYGPGADLVPVTLSFSDVNGDHKLDMIVNFQGTHIVYLNDQGSFRLMQQAPSS